MEKCAHQNDTGVTAGVLVLLCFDVLPHRIVQVDGDREWGFVVTLQDINFVLLQTSLSDNLFNINLFY